MCFFDQHRFACGDWKWGQFRQHCAKEYRMGHTCGKKLVMQTIPTGTKCKLCEKIETKMRRRTAEVDRIGRWQREESNFRTSIDKSKEIIRGLDEDIYELGTKR
ncbi:hypothetical protein IQ06DRAFT_194705, partial [Phaeosphaeriaceae sp. SRC1lsM3a]